MTETHLGVWEPSASDTALTGDQIPISTERIVTESWLCIDCGFNTAPEAPSRAEVDAAMAAHTPLPLSSYDDRCEVYCVTNAVWKAAGMEPWGGCLCIGCLERRLGRKLKPKHFERDHVFNVLPGTARLLRRRKVVGLKSFSHRLKPEHAAEAAADRAQLATMALQRGQQ
jgi:hypothetical protein